MTGLVREETIKEEREAAQTKRKKTFIKPSIKVTEKRHNCDLPTAANQTDIAEERTGRQEKREGKNIDRGKWGKL